MLIDILRRLMGAFVFVPYLLVVFLYNSFQVLITKEEQRLSYKQAYKLSFDEYPTFTMVTGFISIISFIGIIFFSTSYTLMPYAVFYAGKTWIFNEALLHINAFFAASFFVVGMITHFLVVLTTFVETIEGKEDIFINLRP